jgi:hypothetical protein
MRVEPNSCPLRPSTWTVQGTGIMADHTALGILGYGLGGVTAAVMLVATIVVHAHLSGRLSLEGGKPPTISSVSTAIR